ncbi:MAG: hypothetical protein EOO27_12480 [Comamonadaceae bacterium]|nr:MAG: hypothetical protein EOO27_12480 [Comamonadaceae bacterium]
MLLCAINSAATVFLVKTSDATKLEPWQLEDAARLRALYEAYRKAGGLKQDEFAERFGLRSQANLGHYLHARRPLNIEQAKNFATGMGVGVDQFSPRIAAQISAAAAVIEGPSEDEEGEFVMVQRLSVRLSAGAGAAPVVEEQAGALQFRRDFLASCGASKDSARIVNVSGTSMEPTIVDGAVLLVNTRNTEPRNNTIFAIAYGDDLLVKRLISTPKGWVARSDNADGNPDLLIDDSRHIKIIGRAVWMGTKL